MHLWSGQFSLKEGTAKLRAGDGTVELWPNYAWRFTGIAGFKRYVTQGQYEKFTPAVQRWYEPYR